MSCRWMFLACCLFSFFALSLQSVAVSNFCPSGTCDIAHPIYVNVYWDTSVQQWNSPASRKREGLASIARDQSSDFRAPRFKILDS